MDPAFYEKLLDSMFDGVYFVDQNRVITYWNAGAERLSGYSRSEVIGRRCADNILRHVDGKGNRLCLKGCPLAETMRDGKSREADVYMHHKMGHRVPVIVRSAPTHDKAGNIIGAVEIFADNSKSANTLKELEQLQQEVFRDPLTKIANRKYAEQQLDNFLAAGRKHGISFGLLFVDIDHFKKVNDSYGHNTGDEVLKAVSMTLSGGLRPVDTACRWGGEEFVLLLPNIDKTSLHKLAERLRMLVESSWLDHHDGQIRVTASFGGTVSRIDDSIKTMIERADEQTYLSKDRGRNCVHIA